MLRSLRHPQATLSLDVGDRVSQLFSGVLNHLGLVLCRLRLAGRVLRVGLRHELVVELLVRVVLQFCPGKRVRACLRDRELVFVRVVH